MPTRLDRGGVEFYPDDRLPKMQQLLAILADLDQRYETATTWRTGQGRRRSRLISWLTWSKAIGLIGSGSKRV